MGPPLVDTLLGLNLIQYRRRPRSRRIAERASEALLPPLTHPNPILEKGLIGCTDIAPEHTSVNHREHLALVGRIRVLQKEPGRVRGIVANQTTTWPSARADDSSQARLKRSIRCSKRAVCRAS